MKFASKPIAACIFAVAFVAGLSACSSEEKTVNGPEPTAPAAPATGAPAKEAAATPSSVPVKPSEMAQGTVEVQPSAEELARQQREEQERQKKADIERMRREEAQRQAAPPIAPVAPAPVPLASAAPAPAVDEFGKVFFDFDKYEIKSEFRDVLAANAQIIKGTTGKIVLEGHCDERGTEEYNLALGERRSVSVKNYLVSLGIDNGRLYTISYGEERPAAEGHNEEAWSKNRRVQLSKE